MTGFAQSLAVSTNKTVVDGVVKAGEYSFSQEFGPLTLYANRTADTLHLAVVGSTTGWVAVGLGIVQDERCHDIHGIRRGGREGPVQAAGGHGPPAHQRRQERG